MATRGYFSLADLDRIPHLEEDVTVEGLGTFRVRALDQETLRRVMAAAGEDGNLQRQYTVAYGLVAPDLGADSDPDAALEAVRKIGRNVIALGQLYLKINELTFRSPSEAFKDFFGVNGSVNSEAGTASMSSA